MSPNFTQNLSAEGNLREQLATYFLAAPPRGEQTPAQRREDLQKLHLLGQLERQDVCQAAASRIMVWGNPAPLIQAILSAAQRLAAGLGQPILLFPARETAIGADTLLHPRMLSIALCDLLCRACAAAPRSPVWVRLQEQRGGLVVSITACAPFADGDALTVIKECTKLLGGSLVHCDETIVFSCGQVAEPPTGVRLYGCPSEEDLLSDALSPIWSVFYAALYSSIKSAASSSPMSSTSEDVSSGSLHSTESSSTSEAGKADKL